MRYLTIRYRKYLLYRARREAKKRRHRSTQAVSKRRQLAIDEFWRMRASLPEPQADYEARKGYCTLLPPVNFSLSANYEQTLAFIMDMRWMFHKGHVLSPDKKRKLRIFADFSAIQSIEPAAGLVLAAEVDRWRLASGRQPRSHDQEWHPDIQRFFSQAGLFELLGITMQAELTPPQSSPFEALKFVRGFSVQGEPGSRLRDRLEALCGASIGPRKIVYDAIAEAIANTRHAYPSGISIWPAKLAGRWWASGSWRPETRTVSLQLYDQGVGIPSTLPKSEHWSDVITFLNAGEMLHPERRHDRLIEAALEVGRTSTGQQGRGKGLAEMATWIDQRGSGFLRITSGRGCVTYRPGAAINGQERKATFPGTLVEWEVLLDG